MSKIDDLIAQHCPNGVEIKKLWELTAWDKRFNAVENNKQSKIIKYPYVLAKTLKDMEVPDGDVYLLSTGSYEGWTTEDKAGKHIYEGEVVTIPWGGTANVQYYNGKFVTADNRLASALDTNILNNKYLYYFMLNRTDLIQSFYRGSGIQHPSMAQVLDMDIPLPSLPVQEEIVDVLDKFTKLEAELEAELEARQQQYAHYRDVLLSAEGESHIKFKSLSSIASYSDTRIEASAINSENYVGVDNLLQNRAGKTDSNYVPETGRLTCYEKDDILLGNIRPYLKKIWHSDRQGGTNGDVLVIRIRQKEKGNILPRYLYQIIADDNFFHYAMKTAKGAKMPRGNKQMIMKYGIPIPYADDPKKSLAEQERIVSILDKFDALVNDTSSGLPAEITARRQQYEHYRNKLLTFREAA